MALPMARMTIGSPNASAHHFAPMRHLTICESHERSDPSLAQTTTAAPTGGPNPPNPISIECVHDASNPQRTRSPWIVQVNGYVTKRKLAMRWRSIQPVRSRLAWDRRRSPRSYRFPSGKRMGVGPSR
jgi:hypothetical protein